MKKFLVTLWLTLLWYLLLGNVHAWEVPNCLRINGGTRMWFSSLTGDLIQKDNTKLDLIKNVGLKDDELAWEFFAGSRLNNIHVFRFRGEFTTAYMQPKNDSSHRVRSFRVGYDLDFIMAPQVLFGVNVDLDALTIDSDVKNVTVGLITYNYRDGVTKAVPQIGFHGTFYPILQGISLRPNLSGRIDWMNYEGLEVVNWEAGTAVDVPVNRFWTWSVNGGYRFEHTKVKRDRDMVDMNRSGWFIETSVLF
jgi:hypothetical protein